MPYHQPRVLHDPRAQRLASRAVASSWSNATMGLFLMAAFCGSSVNPGVMYGVLRWVVLAVFTGAALAALAARAWMASVVLALIALFAAALAAALKPPATGGGVEVSGSPAEWVMFGGLVVVAVLMVVTVRADRAAGRLEEAAVAALTRQPAPVVRMAPLPAAPAPVKVEVPAPSRPVVDTIRPDLLPAMYWPQQPQVAPVLVPVEVQSAPVEEPAPASTWTVEAVHLL